MLIHNATALGLRIHDRRLELGLSQAALARRIGASRYWVMQVERGNAGAEIGLVFRALRELGLEVEIRVAASPGTMLGSGAGDLWFPDLAKILDRARGGAK